MRYRPLGAFVEIDEKACWQLSIFYSVTQVLLFEPRGSCNKKVATSTWQLSSETRIKAFFGGHILQAHNTNSLLDLKGVS
jgi:hypothetical protein